MRKSIPIPCRFFKGPGTCKKGADCEYLHGKTQNTANPNTSASMGFTQPYKADPVMNKAGMASTQPISHNQRPQKGNNTLCNLFIQGICNRGENCPNKHQFTQDANIDGKMLADFQKIFKANKLGVLAIDVYAFDKQKLFVIMLTNKQLSLIRLPDGESWEFPIPEGKLTAMHYERTEKLLFLGFLDAKTNKGGLVIYKDFGKDSFEPVLTANDLHQKDITCIQTQDYMGPKLIITAGQDDRVKAWVEKSGKLEQFTSGVTTAPIYSTLCTKESVFAGCFNGKVELLRFQDASNGYNRVKEFEVHSEQNSLITKIIKVEETIYATSFYANNNQITGNVGIFADVGSGKILHLADYSMHSGVTTIEYIPTLDMLFVGYSDGTLEFRQKDGFKLKGKASIHKNPIKDIKQVDDMFLVVDEQGLFSIWRAVDKITASASNIQDVSLKGTSVPGMNVESNFL